MILHRLPRIQLSAIAGICALCIVLTITGLTDMVLDADARAERAQDNSAATQPPSDQRRELEALLDLFVYCQTVAWDAPKCRPADAGDAMIDTLENAPARDDDDDDGDTRVTVRTEERAAPTSPSPRPRATGTTPPPDDDDDGPIVPPDELTEPVEDVTETVEDVADRLADVTASAIASSE